MCTEEATTSYMFKTQMTKPEEQAQSTSSA